MSAKSSSINAELQSNIQCVYTVYVNFETKELKQPKVYYSNGFLVLLPLQATTLEREGGGERGSTVLVRLLCMWLFSHCKGNHILTLGNGTG